MARTDSDCVKERKMIDQILQQAVTFIQNTAPIVWQAYVRQNYVYAAWDAITMIACIVVLIIAFRFKDWAAKEDIAEATFMAYLAIGIALVVFFVNAGMVTARVINPYYYAIQDILRVFRSGG
jgi:hypothetical protein